MFTFSYFFSLKLSLFYKKCANIILALVIPSYCLFITSPLNAQVEITSQVPEEFVIAMTAKPTSLDPQFQRAAPNFVIAHHLYDTLFILNERGEFYSNILASYQNPEPHTWILTLKPNIYFSNGDLLTTKDIIYTFDRLAQLRSEELKGFVKRMKEYVAIDRFTLKITTSVPAPLIMRSLSRLAILRYQDFFPTSENFLDKQGYIGTGQYRLIKINENSDIYLEANPYYHGKNPDAKKIRLVYKPLGAERVNALKKGEIHLLKGPTPKELRMIKPSDSIDTLHSPSHRLLHLQIDSFRDKSPYVFDKNGKSLNSNPLKLKAVRQAMSYAINRDFLSEQVLGGAGQPSGQLMLPNTVGHTSLLSPDEWSITKAKKLLAEAGYPNGFQLTIHGTNDRYLLDEEILAAIAEMLSEVGIETKAVSLPMKVFFEKSEGHHYSVSMLGISTEGLVMGMLTSILHSKTDKAGSLNDGRYSNHRIDKLIEQGNANPDAVSRTETYIQAVELAMSDKAIIPLYFQKKSWAIKNNLGVEYWPRTLSYTLASDIKILKPDENIQ